MRIKMKYTVAYHGDCCKNAKLPHKPLETSPINGFKKAVNLAYNLANKHNKNMYIQMNDKTVAVVSPRAVMFSKFTIDGYVMVPVSKYIMGEKK